MKIYLLTIFLCAFGLLSCRNGEGVAAAAGDITAAEKAFVINAQQGHVSEITLAGLAKDHSRNGDVRNFADMIVSDHTNALEKLVEVMDNNRIAQVQGMVPDTQKDIEGMRTLSGIEFDREFMNMMVADHKKAIEEFRLIRTSERRGDVHQYANDTLPALEKHLKEAQELQSRLFDGGR